MVHDFGRAIGGEKWKVLNGVSMLVVVKRVCLQKALFKGGLWVRSRRIGKQVDDPGGDV